jgi:anaerobic ribonucleoside-triphosphate reductase activating protein
MKSAMQLSPAAIIERLLFDDITGLTFSGGEPMEQAAGLAEVARLARRQQDIDIICFSGYRYERLLKNPPNPAVTRLLAEVDVLIDGPFIESRNDSVGLRGSSNQRVIHLTSKLRTHELESDSRRVEMRITNGELVLIGIPTPAIASAIATASSTALGRTVSNERL